MPVPGSNRRYKRRGRHVNPTYTPRSRRTVSKFTDFQVALAACNDTVGQYAFHLNDIEQGNAYYERTGTTVNMLSCGIKGQINPPVTITSYHQNLRIAIVYDRKPNGVSIPVWSDIFEGYTAGFQRVSNRNRFDLLYSKFFPYSCLITAAGYPAIGDMFFSVDFVVPVKSLAEFSADSVSGTIPSTKFGAVYLYFLTDDAYAVNTNCTLVADTRIAYVDV